MFNFRFTLNGSDSPIFIARTYGSESPILNW
jgi:hypothetical protein